MKERTKQLWRQAGRDFLDSLFSDPDPDDVRRDMLYQQEEQTRLLEEQTDLMRAQEQERRWQEMQRPSRGSSLPW